MKLGKELLTAVTAILVLTVMLGIAYPLVMTGVSQVAFPTKADGSQIKLDGKVVGSRLIGRAFVLDTGKTDADGNPVTRPDPKYFQPRPSQSDYSATGTFFSNRGPNSAVGRFFFRDQLAAYMALEGRYDPGLTKAKVPVDAVTTSASGVDPHISKANAAIQAHRIAAVRRLPPERINKLIADNTDGRFLGVIGEPGVNVLELNLALDKEAPAR
jgi:potassium-transporting ATPase KdpC subunit